MNCCRYPTPEGGACLGNLDSPWHYHTDQSGLTIAWIEESGVMVANNTNIDLSWWNED